MPKSKKTWRKPNLKIARTEQGISPLQKHVFWSLEVLFKRAAPVYRLGLAISGGVDSMALATLCHQYTLPPWTLAGKNQPYIGFIVDHGVRPGSGEEAKKVAAELQKLKIRSRILKLDWRPYGDPKALPNFETVARKLRYQALGKACYAAGIRDLLVAHHKDDNAETMLSRIIAGYTGGTMGMMTDRPIPDCEGIYGVHESGDPKHPYRERGHRTGPADSKYMLVETGGVRLHRPLLPCSKEGLIEIATNAKTKWFEDETNADPTLTLRNTIRHLQKTEQLPVALQSARLVEAADRIAADVKAFEKRAHNKLNKMHMVFNPAVGTAVVMKQPSPVTVTGAKNIYNVQARVARDVLQLVSPLPNIPLQDLDNMADALFQPGFSTNFQAGLVDVTVKETPPDKKTAAGKQITIQRSPPIRLASTVEFSHAHIVDNSNLGSGKLWSKWVLFDNRFWIRVGLRTSSGSDTRENHRFQVRFLNAQILSQLLAQCKNSYRDRNQLKDRLPKGESLKWSLPVIVVEPDRASTDMAENAAEVFALPSLDWKNPNCSATSPDWTWQIRYKAVDLYARGKRQSWEPMYEEPRSMFDSQIRAKTSPPTEYVPMRKSSQPKPTASHFIKQGRQRPHDLKHDDPKPKFTVGEQLMMEYKAGRR